MLTRRGFGACAICAATGLVATSVSAQQTAGSLTVGQPQSGGGVTRTILTKADNDAKYVTIMAKAEIAPDTVVARHTHPGVETAYVVEGGFAEFAVQGQPGGEPPKAGSSYAVAANTPHGGKNGPRTTTILVTYVVEKNKPLASPA